MIQSIKTAIISSSVPFFLPCFNSINQACWKGVFLGIILEAMHHCSLAKSSFQFKSLSIFLYFSLHKLNFFDVLFSVLILGFLLLTSIDFPLHLFALYSHIILVIFGKASTPVQKSVLHQFSHSLLVPACHWLILFAVAFPAPHLS